MDTKANDALPPWKTDEDFYPVDWKPSGEREKRPAPIQPNRETRVVNKSSGEPGIFIGRPSIFGNPYTHLDDKKTKAEFVVSSREEAIAKYKEYFLNRIKTDKFFEKAVRGLRGENLICYCRPALTCHGDIIVEWLSKNIDL